ncbi:MAG: restriction endonuclease subunit S, partial [Synergistaceae bacterium]|nr:restriction endonuclease subunit S [Synergistaceae bacterium]
HALLGDGLASLVTDGTHFTPQYVDDGLPFLSALNIKKGYIDFEAGCQHITQEQHEILCRRVRPQEGDILMRKIGTGERLACVVPKLEHEFSIFVSIALIRANISPCYLSAFINSKYGQMQLLRFNKGINQPDLHLEDIRRLLVPLFSDEFYGRITDITLDAQSLRAESESHYTAAQSLLTDSLGHVPQDPRNTATVSFSRAFSAGRLDAEYFMPKYDALFAHLDILTTRRLGEIVSITKSIEPGSDYYTDEGIPFIRVSDITETGITPPAIRLPRNIVPDIEALYPRKDTILLSKDGTVGIAYKVDCDMEAVTSGALLHLRVTCDDVLPDYLALVLNSEFVRLQAERDSNGAIIKHWKPDDIARVVVPVVDQDTQQRISGHVRESFTLRRESQRLISLAVKSVEAAVEYGEDSAMNLITQEENSQ